MSWDIYGEKLQRGHCEVHPWVAVEYPCPVCLYETEKDKQKSKLRKWMFNGEDENGDSHYLQEDFFIGTFEEACHYAETMADEWENKIGELIIKITIESHGKIR